MNLQIIIDFIFGNPYNASVPSLSDVISENSILLIAIGAVILLCVIGLYGIGGKIFGKKQAYKAIIPFYGLWQLYRRVGLSPYLSIIAWIPLVGIISLAVFNYFVARAFGSKNIALNLATLLFPFFMLLYFGFNPKSEFVIVRGKSTAFKDSFKTIMPGEGGKAEASCATQAGIKFQETAEEMRARKEQEAKLKAEQKRAASEKKQQSPATQPNDLQSLFLDDVATGPTTDIRLPIDTDGHLAISGQFYGPTAYNSSTPVTTAAAIPSQTQATSQPSTIAGEAITMVTPITKAFTEPDSPEIANLESMVASSTTPTPVMAPTPAAPATPPSAAPAPAVPPLTTPVPAPVITAPSAPISTPVQAPAPTATQTPTPAQQPLVSPAAPLQAAPPTPTPTSTPISTPGIAPVNPVATAPTPMAAPVTPTPPPMTPSPAPVAPVVPGSTPSTPSAAPAPTAPTPASGINVSSIGPI